MSWFSRLRNAFRPDAVDQEIGDELRFHAEQRGLSRLPRHLALQEMSREARIATWLESVLQDARLALGIWRRRPAVALTAILTLALGAGMNVAVFEVIWNVMLKPLPYAAPEELVQIWFDDGKEDHHSPPRPAVDKWRQSPAFESIAQFRAWRFTVIGLGDPEHVLAGIMSPEFFQTLGIPLAAGRTFNAGEYADGNAVIVRESYLRRHGLSLDQHMNVDGTLCRIVGVVADTFLASPLFPNTKLGSEPDLYLPLDRGRVGGATDPFQSHFVIARLRRGVTLAAASQELLLLTKGVDTRRPWLISLHNEVGRSLRPALQALISATACILLIACANLANLLLAQAVGRRREIAVRIALGASRGRVVRQLLTEALVLSFAGGLAGILAASLMSSALIALYPDVIPRLKGEGSNWAIYAFALALPIASGLIFGALPAWRASRADVRVGSALMSQGTRRWANGLVAAQVALATVVLASAGLLVKSFINLRDVNTGLAPAQLITTSISLPPARYKTREDRARFAREWLDRLNAISGVQSCAVSNSLPIRYTGLLTLRVRIPGIVEEQDVGGRAVGGPYFSTMGMSWLAGGPFDESRKDQFAVNEAFVRRYYSGRNAVGETLPLGGRNSVITGIVRDVRHVGLRQAPQPEIFLPYAAFPFDPVDTAIRTALPEAQITAALRRELKVLDSELVLGKVMTMNAVIEGELTRPRFHMWLLSLFAAVALALAAVGVYGVIAHQVRGRVPEFGLRRALGATSASLFALVLRDGLRAPLAGLALGAAIGWCAGGRFLETLLYGVTARDAVIYLTVVAALGATAVLACVIPGRFATKVEPAVALRSE